MQFEISKIQDVAQDVVQKLQDKNTNILALRGDLGAGKTTLVSAIAKELGVTESIISPTFIIYRAYDIHKKEAKLPLGVSFLKLVHIDAYRLTGEEDVKKLRLDELFADPTNLVCIEWPEHVGGLLPSNALQLHLSYINECMREVYFGVPVDNASV
jgi:tRNA threonylcarbamoyladenosine biosynthesis protein TsaE